MSFWNSKQIKKSRKDHKCEFCGRKIPKGSSCKYEAGVYEGDFQSYYLCNRCVEAFSEWDIDLSDGFSCGEFYDYAYEHKLADCPECNSSNHRESEWSEDTMSCEYECDNCDHIWTADYSLGTSDN